MGSRIQAVKRKRSTGASRAGSPLASLRPTLASVVPPSEAVCLLCRKENPETRIAIANSLFIWVCDRCNRWGQKAMQLGVVISQFVGSKR